MKLRGPIVIMDEAHNARTRISFDSLKRFEPLAVLELTATPQQDHDPDKDEYASNVLHAVSALQLKREGMVKLPVELESRDNWLDVLALTVQRRAALDQRAREWGQESGRFIRPIALIQAQPKSKVRETHTVDAIKKALIEQLKVPADRIRIATGETDDLGAENLASKDCIVEYVLTVDKLREGWDCPFAYVLGSVGNVATETAVEQLLGRVLRMPEAIPTGVAELDRAYALGTLMDRAAVEQYWQTERPVGTVSKALDQYADALSVPQLIVKDGARSYLFEPEELDEYSWNLDTCDPALTEGETSGFDLSDAASHPIPTASEAVKTQQRNAQGHWCGL